TGWVVPVRCSAPSPHADRSTWAASWPSSVSGPALTASAICSVAAAGAVVVEGVVATQAARTRSIAAICSSARRKSARKALLVFVLVGSSCAVSNDQEPTGTSSEAVTSGELDPDDAAVVRVEGGLSPCTGTLIADRVVLTAAHCLDLPVTTVYLGTDA